METLTYEQKRIINLEYEETIVFLMEKIKKYHGKYNTKEFKEWLTSALMLEIDIQKDNTYDEETLSKINKIEFAQEIINFNTYGNIRKFLENYDRTLTFPGGGIMEINIIIQYGTIDLFQVNQIFQEVIQTKYKY